MDVLAQAWIMHERDVAAADWGCNRKLSRNGIGRPSIGGRVVGHNGRSALEAGVMLRGRGRGAP